MRISVVIPAYNAAPWLRETLESVLAQTEPPYEIVVIDDGSRDETPLIAHSYGEKIRYIPQSNQGIAGARNRGILEARGEWIALLDHDDVFLPEKLRKQRQAAEKHEGAVVVYSGFCFWSQDGTLRESEAFPAEDLWPALRYRTPILPSTAMIRKDALIEIGGFDGRASIYMADDWDLWLRLIRCYSAKAFVSVPECLTHYRSWGQNTSADVLRLLRTQLTMINTRLLGDLSGFRCMLWRHRLEAKFFYLAALSLRNQQNPRFWEFAIHSMLRWPFCGRIVPAHRYKVVAHMLWSRLRKPRFELRYWWPQRKTVGFSDFSNGI